ncbi:hypothetical protein [Indioceanicola profundi]|uniref:hypothetical protein n=1 Tax=Indioceanicola profundi TaxID=2220096 RepID=UPI000E6A9BAC|nr:hypothetical protein [Indioceanicola profundi]
MSQASSLRSELHDLLDLAADYSDEQGLSRLMEMLTCLAEGAELADWRVEVPEGLDHVPALHRRHMLQDLLTVEAAGRC